jgi:acyl-CoA thioesterase FadM
MPKTKLQERAAYPFGCDLEVRVTDLNYGAHLGYDRLLGLAHQARLVLFGDWGVNETDLGDGRTGLVASDVTVNYLGEAFVHDRLRFELLPVEVGPITFRLAHRITAAETGRKIALAEIGFAGFDYAARSVARLPEEFRQRLAALAG